MKLYLRLILFGIITIIVLQGYIIIRDQPQTIITSGTTIPLNFTGQRNATFPFYVSHPSMLSGMADAFYPFDFYLMTSSEYLNFTKLGLTYPRIYGDTSTVYVRLEFFPILLVEGEYYLIFQVSGSDNTTVTVTLPFVLTSP